MKGLVVGGEIARGSFDDGHYFRPSR
jgi:hypothetical protein